MITIDSKTYDYTTSTQLESSIIKSKATMPDETKSVVYSSYDDIRAAIYNNGHRVDDSLIMSDIIDVTVANNTVVFVTFADNTKEKAVLASGDYFSLEQGISICIAKKLLSMKTKNNGSSVYNKIIERGLRVFEDKEKQEEAAKQEEQNKRNRINKLKAKKERKVNAKREAQIEMQKEAYLRAMREFNGTSTNAPCIDVVEL